MTDVKGERKTVWARAAQPRYFSRQVIEAQRFYLNLRREVGQDVAVMSGGLEKCTPDYDNARKHFAHPCVEFVIRGGGTLTLDRAVYPLTPGTVFAYGPHLMHRITCEPAAPLWKYFVVFTGREAPRLLEDAGLRPGSVGHIAQPLRLQWLFDDLIHQGLGDQADRARRCAAILHYLVLKIGELQRPADETGARAYATYERVRRLIAERYETLTSLSEIAAACAVDPAYVCRLFQRFGRESPFQYLLHLRLNRAAELLQTTDLLVKDIAARLRFTDAFNFSRTFRHAFGVPPNELRRNRDALPPLGQP